MSAGPPVSPASRPAQANFTHVDVWIFDLDNTLYGAESDLFAQIDTRMGAYVARRLDLPLEDAKRLQKAYYRDHGTTLNGLIKLHGVDPEEFLEEVHDIDLSVLTPDSVLNAAIARLPGRRFVFTNGCGAYAARVLDRIGLGAIADEVWDIRTTRYTPKPLSAAYEQVVTRANIAPKRAAMFDDLARNLVPAHALGMTTVWLDNGSVWSRQGPDFPVAGTSHIDYETEDLGAFLDTIRVAE
jgi:putative hydrolase of the HAD superfamily